MRILYYHQHFSTPAGATGNRSYEFARRLVARGHEVTMVCGSYKGSSTGLSGPYDRGRREGMVDGMRVIEFLLPYSNYDTLLKRSWTFMLFALRSIGLALSERYDLLFATSTPLTASLPGIVASWLRRKRFVFEVRDLWPELPHKMGVIHNPVILGALSALEWAAYHSARACIALSPGMVDGIVRRGIPSGRVAMVPNGCDFLDEDGGIDTLPRPEGVAPGDLMAVFTGTHGLANGLDAVLDAARELKRRGRSDIRLVMIGDGRLKPALRKRAAEEGLDNCLFLAPMPRHDLFRLIRGSDVGLMILANIPAFYYGTSPNKFFDYIALGLPVLNNYPGWVADMLGAWRCGIAVPPRDPAAFADALERMADDRAARADMGRQARVLAEAVFSRDQLADRFIGVLEAAATDRPLPAWVLEPFFPPPDNIVGSDRGHDEPLPVQEACFVAMCNRQSAWPEGNGQDKTSHDPRTQDPPRSDR